MLSRNANNTTTKRKANNQPARNAKRAMFFPSRFTLHASEYTRLRLANGCVVHLLGERHDDYSRCFPPKLFNIPCLIREIVRLGKQRQRQVDLYIERRASQLHPDSAQTGERHLRETLNAYKSIIPLQGGNVKRSNHFRTHIADLRDAVHHPFLMYMFRKNFHLVDNENNFLSDFESNSNNNIVYTHPTTSKFSRNMRRLQGDKFSTIALENNHYYELKPEHRSPNRVRSLVNAVVKSNTYSTSFDRSEHAGYRPHAWFNANRRAPNNRHLPPNPRRNATSFDGKDVSRLRKQILKLGHGLDAAMIQLYDMMYGTTYRHMDILLTDMYAIARMLYYAGYGKTKVATPSKVAMLYGGALHAQNQRVILHGLDMLTDSRFGIKEEYHAADPEEDPELQIRQFKTGLEP